MKHVVFGTGAIGTALAATLAARGHEVVAVSRRANPTGWSNPERCGRTATTPGGPMVQ